MSPLTIVAKASRCWEVGESVRKSGSLSESLVVCQKVGETVRKSGSLSESRVECQEVGETVRKSATLSEKRRRRHGGDNVVSSP